MVVTGIEIAALIASVVSGFNSGHQLVKAHRKHVQKKKRGNKLKKVRLKQLEGLEGSLAQGIESVEREYDRYYQIFGSRFENGDDDAKSALSMVLELQKSLLEAMEQAFIQNSDDFDVKTLMKTKAERCRIEALGSLNQLFKRLEACETPKMDVQPTLQPNRIAVGNLCGSAIAYRENLQEFSAVTRRMDGEPVLRWSCISCGRMVSRTSLSLAPNTKVWITPSGLFKSHCGTEQGWMCIWEGGGEECGQEIATRKDLMLHMVKVHTRKVKGSLDTSVDLPVDLRRKRGVGTCGYGIQIGRCEMVEHAGGFLISA